MRCGVVSSSPAAGEINKHWELAYIKTRRNFSSESSDRAITSRGRTTSDHSGLCAKRPELKNEKIMLHFFQL